MTLTNRELIRQLGDDLDMYGEREVVFKTAGQMYPNSTYAITFEPSWKYPQDKRAQLFPNGRVNAE